jgi:hypothetical protein
MVWLDIDQSATTVPVIEKMAYLFGRPVAIRKRLLVIDVGTLANTLNSLMFL